MGTRVHMGDMAGSCTYACEHPHSRLYDGIVQQAGVEGQRPLQDQRAGVGHTGDEGQVTAACVGQG